MEGMEEIVQEFLIESHENLDQLNQDLLALERRPNSCELLSSVFRTLHTIKGTSGFLALHTLERVAHAGEGLLSKLRDGEMELTPALTTVLLETVDALRALLRHIEDSGNEGPQEYAGLVARLHALLEGRDPAMPVAARAALATANAATAIADATAIAIATVTASPDGVDRAGATSSNAVPTEPVAATQAAAAAQVSTAKAVQGRASAAAKAAAEVAADAGEGDSTRRRLVDSSIRVDVDLLDCLMNLVGELVLTRNQLLQRVAARQDPELLRSMHRLDLVAGELQEGVIKTRMQPIENVWSKLPRVVRDLADNLNKRVRVDMEGEQTELDKTVLEAIKDPLTHLVRNSCDHGIESPAERTAAGKPAEGHLLVRAFHEGGKVIIEIIDDGAGIDTGRLREKAIERQIVSREEGERMSDRDAMHLIFRPGFSTARSVTSVSGRGVGMDVVKTNIEKIGGVIDVNSVVGEGTTVRIKIPLTLAIIPALLVLCVENLYAIPQVNLVELVRLDHEQATERLENIQGTPVYRLRGALLPLVDLREQIGGEPIDRETVFIVVLRADGKQFGLIVDNIEDTEEIVVKPLGKQLRGIDLYAGATIMGDGRIALILDANSLAARAGMVEDSSQPPERATEEAARRNDTDLTSLLVVKLGNGRRAALPLELVERLEELPPSRVERVGANQVVQYRGIILPLVRVADDDGGHERQDPYAPLQVVVCQHRGLPFGLVVSQVLDIVADELAIRTHLDTGGHLGCAVVNGHVTELLDIDHSLVAMLSSDRESLAVSTLRGAHAGLCD
ncbi:MAG TPA: chemotaxis protein CheA [Dermatophilaceae bacterium]|nr:chemotaxis protein CheA [Dermatophilaceae bacterium]